MKVTNISKVWQNLQQITKPQCLNFRLKLYLTSDQEGKIIMDRERIWDKHMQEEGVFLAINLPDLGNEFTVKCKIMLSSLSDFKDSS